MLGVGSEATLQYDEDTQQEGDQVLDLTFARRGGVGTEKATACAVERNSESELLSH